MDIYLYKICLTPSSNATLVPTAHIIPTILYYKHCACAYGLVVYR